MYQLGLIAKTKDKTQKQNQKQKANIYQIS